MSDFVDYITDLINGVEGGSIRQYPKNRPNTHYYLDTESTDTAKDVIAINHKGIDSQELVGKVHLKMHGELMEY